jgi:hypothetical protein
VSYFGRAAAGRLQIERQEEQMESGVALQRAARSIARWWSQWASDHSVPAATGFNAVAAHCDLA